MTKYYKTHLTWKNEIFREVPNKSAKQNPDTDTVDISVCTSIIITHWFMQFYNCFLIGD